MNAEAAGVVEESRKQAEALVGEFNKALAQDVGAVLARIEEIAGGLGEAAVSTMGEIKEEREKRPKVKEVKMVRENGEMKAIAVYEDEEPTLQ